MRAIILSVYTHSILPLSGELRGMDRVSVLLTYVIRNSVDAEIIWRKAEISTTSIMFMKSELEKNLAQSLNDDDTDSICGFQYREVNTK